MIYSVFNWNSMNYDYFQSASGAAPGNRAQPRRMFSGKEHGQRPEDVMPVLPDDAVLVGTGQDARGRVAVLGDEVMARGSSSVGQGSLISGYGAEPSFFEQNPYLSIGLVVGGSWLGFKLLIALARRL